LVSKKRRPISKGTSSNELTFNPVTVQASTDVDLGRHDDSALDIQIWKIVHMAPLRS